VSPQLTQDIEQDVEALLDDADRGLGIAPTLSRLAAFKLSIWWHGVKAEDPASSWLIGLCHEHGVGFEVDREKAVQRYEEAAHRGFLPALLSLSELLRDLGDVARAQTLLESAAEARHPAAMCRLAIAHLHRQLERSSAETGMAWLRRAAEAGSAIAQINLGACYADGDLVEEDPRQAVLWYRRAAERGHRGAKCLLGMCYEDGTGVALNPVAAASLYEEAALDGDLEAHLLLGNCLENGIGVEPDLTRAVHWYTLAAELGQPAALVALGSCALRGAGMKKDVPRAIKCFERAAKRDNADAFYQLGLCSSRGVGLEQDHFRALKYYQGAALRGHVDALYCIGVAFSRGDGVERCLETAFQWFERAAARGSALAISALDEQGVAVDDYRTAIAHFVAVVTASEATFDKARRAAAIVLEATVGLERAALDDASRRLLPALEVADFSVAGIAAVLGATMVENGGAANLSVGSVLSRLPGILRRAVSFHAQVVALQPLAPTDANPLDNEALLATVSEREPDAASAWFALDFWCQAAIAMLSRDAEVRRRVRRTPFEALVAQLAAHHSGAKYLHRLLAVPDRLPLLVLHTQQRRGFRVLVSGVDTIRQLELLLAERMLRSELGASGLFGDPPHKDAVAVARGDGPQTLDELSRDPWAVTSWTGLSADYEHAPTPTLNQGSIGDIESFEGLPTLLLGPPTRDLGDFTVCRTFAALQATVHLEETLSEDDVADLLARMHSVLAQRRTA